MKQTVRLTLWGPYTTRYTLACGHVVEGKTRATIPAQLECSECDAKERTDET